MSDRADFRLFSFHGRYRVLHLTWFAFFLAVVAWFSHASLMAAIRETLGLTNQQVAALLILNVALTIPARILIGMLVDSVSPKLLFSSLLFIGSLLCFFFAFAETFQALALAKLLLGFVGAGFVIGIRLIGEWFPARQVGLAEGIFAGWGNFGSAAAAMTLPALALYFGGDDGWRYAMAAVGAVTLVYALVYYFSVSDTPKGSTYFKPRKAGAMEVSSQRDFVLYAVMSLGLYGAIGMLIWRLSSLDMLGSTGVAGGCAVLVSLYVYQLFHIYRVNEEIFRRPVAEIHRYKFKQVAILSLCYFVTFGSELAVVSMLPLFFFDTFGISQVQAGLLASGFALTNLVARPAGGHLSDRIGRKRSLLIFISGLTLGFFVLSRIDAAWSLASAVAATMACSFLVQCGSGAVFAAVPLIKRRLTGQIAGMTGAYGNVGAVVFLAVLSLGTPQMFFFVIGAVALLSLVIVTLFDEPAGAIAEVLPDGTVQMIEVT